MNDEELEELYERDPEACFKIINDERMVYLGKSHLTAASDFYKHFEDDPLFMKKFVQRLTWLLMSRGEQRRKK